MNLNRRGTTLIDPDLQWRLILLILSSSGIAVLFQAGFMLFSLNSLANELPADGGLVEASIGKMLFSNLLWTIFLFAPVLYVFVMKGTFRIAGPVYAIRKFLHSVVDGEQANPCHLRDGDHFQDLCSLVNLVTEEQRNAVAEKQEQEAREQEHATKQAA